MIHQCWLYALICHFFGLRLPTAALLCALCSVLLCSVLLCSAVLSCSALLCFPVLRYHLCFSLRFTHILSLLSTCSTHCSTIWSATTDLLFSTPCSRPSALTFMIYSSLSAFCPLLVCLSPLSAPCTALCSLLSFLLCSLPALASALANCVCASSPLISA